VEWPGDLGAPYVDVNENGIWDPGIDRPRFFGDQQIWGVINDVNDTLHSLLGATPPMGLEVQTLYYALDAPHPLENTMFIHWKIINKSDAHYDSTYVGIWSDVDLGDANDDLPGCDTTLALGYVYNGTDFDGTSHGYGSTPPAIGLLLLQGPVVPGAPDDSARMGDGWQRGAKNLTPTSMITPGETCCFAQLQGIPDGTPEAAPVAYDYLRGLLGDIHQPLYRADSSICFFWFSGDPVAGTGYLPENFPLGPFPPSDLRILVNAGPFTLAKGDTQEVMGAVVMSRGANRLESITLLKQDVAWIRDFYGSGGVVSVEEDQRGVPEKVILHQNYPNPFNPRTTIEFGLPHAGYVTLKVYNVLGEEVATLVDGLREAGYGSIRFDATGLASGMYLYRLITGNYAATRKLLVLK
jgi:hypothetical protein